MPLIAAAGITAGGGLLSGLFGKKSAQSAASQQSQAAQYAADLAHKQYLQTRSDLLPYNAAGQQAVGELSSFVDGTNPTGELSALENTPGYQFALTQGLKSVQNANAAKGLGVSGAALKGAAQYTTGLAQNTYQQNLLQPLQYLGSLGENAGAQTGTIGAGLTSAQGNYLVGGANAQAAGQVGGANALTSGLGSATNGISNYLLYNSLIGGGGGTYGSSNANDPYNGLNGLSQSTLNSIQANAAGAGPSQTGIY